MTIWRLRSPVDTHYGTNGDSIGFWRRVSFRWGVADRGIQWEGAPRVIESGGGSGGTGLVSGSSIAAGHSK